MEEPPPPSPPNRREQSSPSPAMSITDLNVDSLDHCAAYLSLQDISNMVMTCKHLKMMAYSDSIWERLFRERWPQQPPSAAASQVVGGREAYLSMRKDCLQFKFFDPLTIDYQYSTPDRLLLSKNNIIFSEGSIAQVITIDSSLREGSLSPVTLNGHTARITCMRLFPLSDTSLYRSEAQKEEHVLVTSSADHSIRLWWKGSSRRCFRGHGCPVSALSDKLLGDGGEKLLASGGEDGTVRLWSLSSGKRGQQPLKATLYGHEKPIRLMSVAGHKTSVLVTISGDSKVRVWDTNLSASVLSFCVGMASVPGSLIAMKCYEQLLYVAAGSSVTAIDLRTMEKVAITATDANLYSFEALPAESLFCVGSKGRAMLYDMRKNQGTMSSEPIVELDCGNTEPVKYLHLDSHKIVTGTPASSFVNVWDTGTGALTNSLTCGPKIDYGCCALAVDGYRIVTGSARIWGSGGCLLFRDFANASSPVSTPEVDHGGKFWSQSFSDTDSGEEEVFLA